MIELSKAWAVDPHRPVWLQEVGAPAPLIPAEHAAAFTEATVVAALDCPDVWGVTWWCSHDVSRSLADFPELEYSLGLLTNDGAGQARGRGDRPYRRGVARARLRAGRRVRTALVVDDAPARAVRVCPRRGGLRGVRAAWWPTGCGPTGRPREPGRRRGVFAARGITEVVPPEVVQLSPRHRHRRSRFALVLKRRTGLYRPPLPDPTERPLMHDDRTLVEARLKRVLDERIRPAVYPASVPLDVAVWIAPGEPVPVAEGPGRRPRARRRWGSAWGAPWATTWFRVPGRVPRGVGGPHRRGGARPRLRREHAGLPVRGRWSTAPTAPR